MGKAPKRDQAYSNNQVDNYLICMSPQQQFGELTSAPLEFQFFKNKKDSKIKVNQLNKKLDLVNQINIAANHNDYYEILPLNNIKYQQKQEILYGTPLYASKGPKTSKKGPKKRNYDLIEVCNNTSLDLPIMPHKTYQQQPDYENDQYFESNLSIIDQKNSSKINCSEFYLFEGVDNQTVSSQLNTKRSKVSQKLNTSIKNAKKRESASLINLPLIKNSGKPSVNTTKHMDTTAHSHKLVKIENKKSEPKSNNKRQQEEIQEQLPQEEMQTEQENDELNDTAYLLKYDIEKNLEAENNNECQPEQQEESKKQTAMRTTLYQQKPKQIRVDPNTLSIVCHIANAEPCLKRAMQRLGWIENNVTNSNQFHIKFDIQDKEGTSSKLRQSQWYNHFQSNRELTTKAGLCKNLWFQCPYEKELGVSSFFPRCYDLSDQKQLEFFLQDFNQTAILSIVKHFANLFLSENSELLTLLKEYQQKKMFTMNKVFKQKFKVKCSKLDYMRSGNGNFIGNDNLRLAVQYVKNQIFKNLKINRDCNKNKHKPLQVRKFTDDEITSLVEYNQQILMQGIDSRKITIYEQIKVIRLHFKLQEISPQYQTIDGTNNVWVVKPSYNARGVGVYCSNKLSQIVQHNKKFQSKIVQKYIEQPFLVNQKKFDIRQWVLVTSWEPLDVYVFQSAYLKICGSEFSLSHLNDQFRHLSNFSVQKTNKQFVNEDLVMSHLQFEQYVRENTEHKSFTWQENLFPKILDLAYKTMRGVSDPIEHQSNCFEIYGLDIILDAQSLNPWLIEVNLSPACNERTEWLTKMLDDRNLDLLLYLQPRILINCDDWMDQTLRDRREEAIAKSVKELESLGNNNIGRALIKKGLQGVNKIYLNEEKTYEEFDIEHKWVRVPESLIECKLYIQSQANLVQTTNKLEIVGVKTDVRKEKQLDKQYKKIQAAKVIQRQILGWMGRQKFKRALWNKCSILVQRHIRRNLAQRLVNRMRQDKASLLIQRHLRTHLALKLVQKMKQERIEQAKKYAALKLQSHYRRKKAYQQYLVLLKHAKATVIQKSLKSMLSKRKVRQMMEYKTKVIRIQRFYKKRFNYKNKKSVIVQKYLKSYLIKQKVCRLKNIFNESNTLLKILNTKKKQQFIKYLSINSKVVTIQTFLKKHLAQKIVKALKKDRSQQNLQLLFTKYAIKQIKQISHIYNTLKHQKAVRIQVHLRKLLAQKQVKLMKFKQLMNQSTLLIQRYLRGYIACKLVKYRQQQIKAAIRIQSFFRGIIAKKFLKRLKFIKKRENERKQKEIDKNFSQQKKVEKEIENYIESLFHKEIQIVRQTSTNQQVHSQTPNNKGIKHCISFPYHQKPIRQSYSSQTKIRLTAQGNQKNNESMEQQEAEILAQSIMNEDFVGEERQQKEMRIRKGIKGLKQEHNIFTNFSQNKAQNGNQKATANQTQHPKQKTFSENLIQLLAQQNIGQVFSENPVEAISVFKEPIKKERMKKKSKLREPCIVDKKNNILNTEISAQAQQQYQQFPKLNEFKSATNNIYLLKRPIQDPRKETLIQQQLIDDQQRMNTSLYVQSPYCKTDPLKCEKVQRVPSAAVFGVRRSTDSLTSAEKLKTCNNNENLLQRPRDANLAVLKAIKKSHFNPFEQKKRPLSKQNRELQNVLVKTKKSHEKLSTSQNFFNGKGGKADSQERSQRSKQIDNNTKLIIL